MADNLKLLLVDDNPMVLGMLQLARNGPQELPALAEP